MTDRDPMQMQIDAASLMTPILADLVMKSFSPTAIPDALRHVGFKLIESATPIEQMPKLLRDFAEEIERQLLQAKALN